MNNIIFKTRVFRSVLLLLLLSLPFVAFGKREAQRQDFLAAKEALKKGKLNTFYKLSERLEEYVLYPYLQYELLSQRLAKTKNIDVIAFLDRYDNLPMTNSLRRQWYHQLISRNEWNTFLKHYKKQDSLEMQCHHLLARYKTENQTYLLEDIRSIWLHGRSLPSNCNPLFKLLYASNLMTSDLAYERVRLAMKNKKTSLAKYLDKFLNKKDKKWLGRWLAAHRDPNKHTNDVAWEDNQQAKEILVYAIQRLARKNIAKSVSRWQTIKTQYTFSEIEIAQLEKELAIYAARQKSDLANKLFSQLPDRFVDKSVFTYQLKTALRNRDWHSLREWTEGKPPADSLLPQWQYWRARALMETGNEIDAKALYAEVAKERDYYGFLAADRLGINYSMNNFPLAKNEADINGLLRMPAMKRTYELYQLDLMTESNREWHHALNKMTTYQMQIAAAIAFEWGWYNRAIMAAGKAKAYDDLTIRFPVLHENLLQKYAKKNGLDPAWMTGLIRAESAFKEDAKSPVGALGLMQVMPRTGKETARKIGFSSFKPWQLLAAATNIPVGSAYLKNMENKFKGNKVLATAAYNAGPHRVVKWLPESGCHEPDIWIELIPFKETHTYVRQVLFYANIYDWKYNNSMTLISERMKTITPKAEVSEPGLHCTNTLLSQQ